MAWIESHQTLAKHRKTLRAAGRLSVDRATLIGHLHLLWWWGLDNVPSDGNLGDITDYELAEAAEWRGDPTEFVAALTEAGFIDERDGERRLHDWYDYAGKLLEKREKERERSRQRRTNNQRSTDGRPADGTTVDREKLRGTVPNRTVPNLSGGGSNASASKKRETPPVAAATPAAQIADDTISPLKFYEQSFGTVCPQTSLEVIDEFEAKGLQPSAIKWAIYEHRLSDGRGPKHLRRIMQRLLDDGLLTAEAAEAHERERRQRTTHPRASPAYDETSWIDAELARLQQAAGGEAT